MNGIIGKSVRTIWDKLTKHEILDLAEIYGDYLKDVNADIFVDGQSNEEIIKVLQEDIEHNILDRKSLFRPNVPLFFKQIHPEMFLDENAPDTLKKIYYDSSKVAQKTNSGGISFNLIKENPEWSKFLKGKDLSRAFPEEYGELFKRFDSRTLMKLGKKNPDNIEKMVYNNKANVLEKWYKSTGGKFLPHYVVMLNFPENEIDNFLKNSKRWSQLMKLDKYNINDDGKAVLLKVAYTMGVFHENDDGFNSTMKLFTDIPKELTQKEYEKVEKEFKRFGPKGSSWEDIFYSEDEVNLFKDAYILGENKKYVFSMDKQMNKKNVGTIRGILEHANIDRILTPMKAHQMFDSFVMQYDPMFVKFFNENVEELLSNPECIKYIDRIQRDFKEIVKINAGRGLTLDFAIDYVKNTVYTNIDIGNEGVAEQAKIAGYSQNDFEEIQKLYNEGELRDFSSIPRIKGSTKGYTYEMLRCDDPLALTIGTLSDCCQEIHGAGQTSMEHSVVSQDGRVFCVRDTKGRIVAQSWFWRNKYTGCFDNIEIPNRIFKLYEKENPEIGRKGLTADVLEVYKKAAQDLMQEEEKVYKELLAKGTITKEQYDALRLRKVTIGLGYNDIADAIQTDKTIHIDKDLVQVKGTNRLPHPYTDAKTQYTVAERDGIAKSKYKNIYVHQDDIQEYDGTNMTSTVLLTIKRMEQSVKRNKLAYLYDKKDKDNIPESQKIINSIAREYGFKPIDTRILATARIVIIYSREENNKIKIGDLLSSPLKKDLTEEQKQIVRVHIRYQIKKALKQIKVQDSEVDISLLNEEQQQIIQSLIQEIEKEERVER